MSVAFPPRSASTAQLGYNIGSTFADLASLDLALASGATLFRAQPGWASVERYSGGMALPANWDRSLAHLAANGGQPVLVAAYGPPYAAMATLTVGAAGAPVGAYAVPVTGPLDSIDPPSCHVLKAGNVQITGRWGYYGSLIDSVDTGAGTITLAAKLTVALKAGDKLTVNRLKYPSIATDADPQIANYLAYVRYLAEQIATYGPGYICLWNETPWAHDPWHNRARFYDNPPATITASDRFKGMLTQAAAMALPAGVALINGNSDKTGSNGVIWQGVPLPAESPLKFDGWHPYGASPEASAFDPTRTTGSKFPAIDPIDAGMNFNAMAYADTRDGRVRPMATECGIALADDTRQAVYLLRRVLSLWGMNSPAIIYSFAESDPAYAVAPKGVPRASYYALQRLMQVVGRMEAGAPAASGTVGVPYPATAATAGVWETMSTTLVGPAGHSCLFAWLRTRADTSWASLPTPAPQVVQFSLPDGSRVAECINLRTGAAPAYTATAGVLTLSVTDEPIGVRLAPVT